MNTKECECCGSPFIRRKADSSEQWESRRFCSISCKNKSNPPEHIHLRFWRKVEKSQNGCMIWVGSTDNHGYGQINQGYGRSPIKTHRLSWELHNGEIPFGLSVCHKCDNPKCVNPDHLFLGTQKDNMMDCASKGRLNKKSFENLQPGAKGYYGAGPLSKAEINKCAE